VKRSVNVTPLVRGKSDERHVFDVVNNLLTLEGLQIQGRYRVTTKATGTYVPIWSDSIDTGQAWFANATILGVCSAGGCWYHVQGGFRNSSGSISVIGGGLQVVMEEDFIAADATFQSSGSTLSLVVKDDGSHTMDWTAYLTLLPGA
jgi:hypothetical protein